MIYKNKQVFNIFLLGFSSGLPFLLILSTLSVWLTESAVSKTEIGLMALVTVPYAFKFVWAPIIDNLPIPYLTAKMGQRRSWLLLSQLLLIISIVALGSSEPSANLMLTGALALIVGFCSANQDIVIEAFRIETLPVEKVGHGATAAVLGYRTGMLVSGAGTLAIAHFFNWHFAYYLIAGCIGVGVFATITGNEPEITNKSAKNKIPLKLFLQQHNWLVIIPFIFCYKFSDTILQTMSLPFLIELGFSKLEIANVAKTFGITAMIIGGIVGGIILNYYNLHRCLLVCAIMQLIASLLFVLQAVVGHDLAALFLTMGMENLTSGMSQVALIAYLSRLCSQPNTAAHYAIVSSFASVSRVLVSMGAGWLADHVSWINFYQLVTIGCLPVMLILLRGNYDNKIRSMDQTHGRDGGINRAV